MNHKQAVKLDLIWCGECYAGLRGREAHTGHLSTAGVDSSWRAYEVALKRNVSAGNPNGPGSGEVAVCEFAIAYPDLYSFLTLARWPDGSARSLGTILVCVEGGSVKGWLNDKDGGLSCWLSAGTLTDLWRRMDAVCGGGEADWRTPRPQGGKGKR